MTDLTLHKILKLAVSTEEVGEKFYARLAKRFADNTEVSEVFTRLSKDEVAHAEFFKKLLDTTPQTDGDKRDYEPDEFVRAAAVSQFFKQDELENIDTITTADDALFAAASLERNTLMFYQALAESLGTDDPMMAEIIAEEKRHLTTVMKVLMAGAKFRTLNDKWA